MVEYKQILAAVDFSDHSDRVIEKAISIALEVSDVHVIHVVDYFPMMDSAYDGAFAYTVDMSDELVESSRKKLDEFGTKHHLTEEQLSVEVGAVRQEILSKAEKMEADLIVIGSHGWRGLDLLLGSTADGVLHHAKSDVLVVRIE